ncbi:flagellum-specific ATP synthase [Variovorax boronicumulans]|uniref:FliI/YscN family ATPase n=1 Tax=Variovorax boronicumulans TaxID=436515 RepID=UPI0027807D10|nr:FliI/YscN family ATPase [Variovorax boronicumulans]MDP9992360.1 flagellum-specific ATP synthase [Variovorax boronicumulans]MDQ0002468.1 flagellum-specific ATP synthase [Variovorax boronicumulans]
MGTLDVYREAVKGAELNRRIGWVKEMQGLAIDALGPDAAVGELCRIMVRTQDRFDGVARDGDMKSQPGVLAEVVGLKPGRVTLMPYGSVEGIAVGCEVRALGAESQIGVGNSLLGRVIDGFGDPLDGKPRPVTEVRRPLKAAPINPMQRPPIDRVLETGIRAIDGLLTLGQGQRIGIFAGSGVGKSTLLGLLARHVKTHADSAAQANINVIALIGERGREVREFIEKQLGPEGLARSVVVVATSDQPALARLRAAYAALAIAEFFRDGGHNVLLTMDSITRFAMARREVGLSAGEPPTARGYTPSVFAELPELCERCGTAPGGGSITALLTVLVEGDDLNEPVSDALRAILDGHVVLSRHLAHRGHYPAIDVLKSVSRLMPELADKEQRALAVSAVQQLAVLERNRQMIDIGAYEKGSSPELDRAIELEPGLQAWLRQSTGGVSRAEAIQGLRDVLAPAPVSATAPAGRKP